jgi:hypothetical protein
MRSFNLCGISFALLFILLAGSGCDRASKPLPPLPLDQLPAALEKAFAKAEAETKDLAGSVGAAVRSQDYAKAFLGLQTLVGRPNLSREQSDVTARGMITVHQALQEAQEKGDAAAAQTLQFNRQNR